LFTFPKIAHSLVRCGGYFHDDLSRARIPFKQESFWLL